MSGDPGSPARSAVAAGAAFGLYDASDFRLADGRCTDCPTIRQGLWYFRDETIAVPRPGIPVAAFGPGVSAVEDLRAWVTARVPGEAPGHPPLVWVAAPDVVAGARFAPDAAEGERFPPDPAAVEYATVEHAGGRLRATLTPKIALNRSYFDASSAAFFARRSVRLRGRLAEHTLLVRTPWPEDFRLDRAPPDRPLDPRLPATQALRALIRGDPAGGARSPFGAWTLWRRDPRRDTAAPGRAVLGLMVNGAQGDDDEAHGGHFALVTGRTRDDGAIADWLVSNFYSLDIESEKGILAAPVPLDNYLADLNSGQGWYRPSHLLVAVLAADDAAALVQAALNRVYNQFWRHQLVYRHASMNCASISVDTLRALGWDVPSRGPASRPLAMLAMPWFALKERSAAKARVGFDYLWEDQTRLMPAAAVEDAGASLLALAAGSRGAPPSGVLAGILARDVEALAFVRFPQFPSSRAFGDAPAVTPWEFHARVPAEPGLAQIVPVPPRPFPAEMRDPDLRPPPRPASDWAVLAWALLLVAGLGLLAYRWW